MVFILCRAISALTSLPCPFASPQPLHIPSAAVKLPYSNSAQPIYSPLITFASTGQRTRSQRCSFPPPSPVLPSNLSISASMLTNSPPDRGKKEPSWMFETTASFPLRDLNLVPPFPLVSCPKLHTCSSLSTLSKTTKPIPITNRHNQFCSPF